MEDKSLIKKYESFLKLNNLELTSQSAKDFIDLEEGPTLMELSMEYVKKGITMQTKPTKLKYFLNALQINPDNFLAKVTIVETNGFKLDDYRKILDEEYERLLSLEYLDGKYYPNNIVDFARYQETFNYLRGLRSYYITLIAQDQFDNAIRIGTQILELNPTDNFHVKSSLCFLYLKAKDDLSALSLFKDSDDLIKGTKELTEAYARYLNNDKEGSLKYLSLLEKENPYLYRLVTGEISVEASLKLESMYSDSLYVYLGLVTIGKDLKGFEPIVKESKENHPILGVLSEDEMDIMITSIFENITYFNMEYIRKVSKDYKKVCHIYNFSDKTLELISYSLTEHGILKQDQLTTYGKIIRDYVDEYLFNMSEKEKAIAFDYLSKNNEIECEKHLLEAMAWAPHNYFIKKDYLFHHHPFDFDFARDLIHNMGLLYKDYESFKSYSSIFTRQKLEEAMDEIHFKYYSNAYLTGGLDYLIEAYTKLENQFVKYTNLIQMAQVLRNDELPNDSVHAFYNLYKDYREKGILSYQGILDILKKSKIEYSDFKRDTKRIPYGILDPKFERNYLGVLEVISLEEILNKEEWEVLSLIREGGKKLSEASVSYSYLFNSFHLEKSFFIKDKNGKNIYELYPFVEEFFKKTQK